MKLPLHIPDWPELWKERFAERAAIKEFDGKQPKYLAELSAAIDIRAQAEKS